MSLGWPLNPGAMIEEVIVVVEVVVGSLEDERLVGRAIWLSRIRARSAPGWDGSCSGEGLVYSEFNRDDATCPELAF